ncbi:MAG: hypothetical protein ACPG4U_10120 [Pseudomonadales bacterium]
MQTLNTSLSNDVATREQTACKRPGKEAHWPEHWPKSQRCKQTADMFQPGKPTPDPR